MKQEKREKTLFYYLCLTYIAILINSAGYLKTIKFVSATTVIFAAAVYISYCMLYLLITFLPLHLLDRFLSINVIDNTLRKLRIGSSAIIYTVGVVVFSLLQILIFTDRFIFAMYDFHLNGFVWNIVFTTGGLESLGADKETKLIFFFMTAGFVLLQLILLVVSRFLAGKTSLSLPIFLRRTAILAIVIFLLSLVFQGLAYGISSIKGYVPVLAASKAFPLYQPVTFRGLVKSLGFKENKDDSFKMKTGKSLTLKYPLNPIIRDSNNNKYNLVFLVAETLRADMLTQEIMPSTWDFAQKSINCTNNYGAGNGTRMSLFGIFYGLYGNYWFSFLNERKGPLLIDLLIEDNYQFALFTSAAFTYPEFDKTVFARIDPCNLHPFSSDQGWKSDRRNISQLTDFIDKRDPCRPFMTFMFFESAHARYYFPPDTIIRPDYLKDFSYTVDIKKNIGLIKNRYINSCHHLDTQIARVIDHLKDSNLLDSTIIIITGDHGEEFMEHGRWGHNSNFTEEQTRTPLVLWVPRTKPQVITSMTSHLDIAPTLMKLLGITNPADDYCLGLDLLGDKKRNYTIISDWDRLVYVDEKFKAVFPLKAYGFGSQNVTTHNDDEVSDTDIFYKSHRDTLRDILSQAGKFTN
jgi:membrane-anchored protein YejM (alkaline phosphatase superfamily)